MKAFAPTERPAALDAWDDAAVAWAGALRDRRDPAREIADAAMVEVIRQVPTGPVLDAGCGEGWLARELAAHGHKVTAFDGSPVMLELALEAAPDVADYRLLTFQEAAAGPRRMGGAFGTIVFNFSLLDERITPVLTAAGAVLFPYGRILIQAAHPASPEAHGPEGYRDGWRTLGEAAPGEPLPSPVPWYFRTFTTWVLELRRAGLLLVETYEPLDPATGRPVSLLLSATIPEKRHPKN
ncbi:MAG: class I SAM-dependent methyltransferase [Longimicrobiaceae bacterium]